MLHPKETDLVFLIGLRLSGTPCVNDKSVSKPAKCARKGFCGPEGLPVTEPMQHGLGCAKSKAAIA